MHNFETAAKDAIRALLGEVTSTMLTKSVPLDKLRGIALFDPERDAILTSLRSFDAARQTVTDIPHFVGRFGAEAATRIVLQFAYQYFQRVDSIQFQEAAFETLWCDFTAEIQDSYWVVRGVANVRNFDSENHLIDLGDGITIRGRSNTDLASLGFGTAVWERITEDWRGLGASSFILVAEHSFAKQPDNLILLDSYNVSQKTARAIQALRLAETGSISIGPMWTVRPARFNVGLGGLTSIGASIPASGSRYSWTKNVEQVFFSIYGALEKLEKDGYGRSPGNLQVALRAFMATYDRWPSFADSQILDAITALEALLGTDTEISFKLSFRVAALLATSDAERATLLKLMKDFYDTRSKVVHGAHLKEKHHRLFQRVDELRSIVRQLLRSFVTFAATPHGPYGKAFWQEQLDVALVDATQREKLRAALGLI